MKIKKIYKLSIVSIFIIFGFLIKSTPAQAAVVDLKNFFPNPQLFENYYLEGMNNLDPNNPTRSVLWFKKQDPAGLSFKLYNSAPEDVAAECNWDLFTWANDKLTYGQTQHNCNGHNKSVIYGSGVQFLPRYWDDTASWTTSGSTSVTTTKLDGSTGCTGTNTWTATILGYETISPGVQAIHWRSQQNTVYDTGNDAPYCVASGVTPWQEDYYLVSNIAVTNYQGLSSASGLYRSVGGNVGSFEITGVHDWDITFSEWRLLPGATPQSVVVPPSQASTIPPSQIPGAPNAGKAIQIISYFVPIAFVISGLGYLAVKRRSFKSK